MRIYLSGQISGAPENIPVFNAAAERLRSVGHDILSPIELDEIDGVDPTTPTDKAEYARLLARDMLLIAEKDIEAIALLPGWEKSRGAKAEVEFARACGLKVYTLDNEYGLTLTKAADPSAPHSGVRTFDSGATRDQDESKPDYEGFLAPPVVQAFGRYMHRHRFQSDGSMRASDNWQKGIPRDAYMKSAWRHFMDWWSLHRGAAAESDVEEALCALIFNAQGYLFEWLKEEPCEQAS